MTVSDRDNKANMIAIRTLNDTKAGRQLTKAQRYEQSAVDFGQQHVWRLRELLEVNPKQVVRWKGKNLIREYAVGGVVESVYPAVDRLIRIKAVLRGGCCAAGQQGHRQYGQQRAVKATGFRVRKQGRSLHIRLSG